MLTGVTIGGVSGALRAGATNLPALNAGQITESEYLERIGWSSLISGALGGVLAGILSRPTPPAPAKPALGPGELIRPTSTALARPIPELTG